MPPPHLIYTCVEENVPLFLNIPAYPLPIFLTILFVVLVLQANPLYVCANFSKKRLIVNDFVAHQSPSCFLGPCHPGKSSPAWRLGGPQSKDPGRHPPPSQTGCPEQGTGKETKTKDKVSLFRLFCWLYPAVLLHTQLLLLYCTSSLLLSRLDIETSSIFICQNYQMSRRCCGHAVVQQALAKTGLHHGGKHRKQHGSIKFCSTYQSSSGVWSTYDAFKEMEPTYNCTTHTARELLPTLITYK